MENQQYFYCYTAKLSRFLAAHNIQYIIKAKSIKDDKIFTMYHQNEKLSLAIKLFNETNTK